MEKINGALVNFDAIQTDLDLFGGNVGFDELTLEELGLTSDDLEPAN